MPQLTTLAATFIACLGSATLGFENRPGLTGANITTADNRFGPTSQNNPNRTITNKDNSLYVIEKLDLDLAKKDLLYMSREDFAQHDSKPATPEQEEAYIRKNIEAIITLSFLGVNFKNHDDQKNFKILNMNGLLTALPSSTVSPPKIPDILKMDTETIILMKKIHESPEFEKLKSQRMDWIKKEFGPELSKISIPHFIKGDKKIKDFLDSVSIEESPDNKGVSKQECQKKIESSLDSSNNLVVKPLTSIKKPTTEKTLTPGREF